MTYELIRPLAFRPASPDAIPTRPFYKLSFPHRWHKELSELWKSPEANQDWEVGNLPMGSLNCALRAVVPDLIYVQYPKKDNNFSWLYSSHPIDTGHLLSIVQAWVEVSLKDIPEGERYKVVQNFKSNDLHWQHCEWSGNWGHCPNGTAKPVGEFFTVLPYYLAAQLTNQPFEIGEDKLYFKRYPLSVGSSGAELMSWPPRWYENEEGSGYYALYINLTMQTVAFHPDPLLYIHAGTRRFVGPEVTFTKNIKSAIIYTQVPWLKGLVYENSFQLADVVTRKVVTEEKKEDEKDTFELRWDDDLVEIIGKINIGNPLPSARELLGQRENYTFGNTHALLLHNTSVGTHAVATGLSPADRSALLGQLRRKLGDSWQPVADYPKVPQKLSFKAKNPFDSNNSKATAQMRIERIKAGVGNVLQLWICYAKEETKQAILEELTQQLGFSCKEGVNNIPIEKDILKVEVKCWRVNEIGDRLDYQVGLRPSRKKKWQAYKTAFNKRIQQITAIFPPRTIDSTPAGVLFELRGPGSFPENNDPKEAIRQGLAQHGYLTQFINANEKSKTLTHRVKRAVLDLYRQIGVLPFKPACTGKSVKLPASLNIIAIWIIRYNSRFGGPQIEIPVAVHIRSNSEQILVKPQNQDWLSYDKAQLALAKHTFREFYQEKRPILNKEQRHRQMREWLSSILENLPQETLLLTDAHNLRGVWKDIQNSSITINRLSLEGMLDKSVSEVKGLRLIRLREDKSNEAPLVFTFDHKNDDESEVGLTQGVYTMTERVFASVGAKPKTAQVTAKSSKFGPYNTKKNSFPATPDRFTWNPRVCELTVYATQEGDDPAVWASFAHQLRKMALQFDDTTILPLPLHLADKLEEYVGK